MRELNRVETFLKDIWIELTQKVTWPSRKQLLEMTAVVTIFVCVWALYVGVLDFAFAKGFEKFLDYARVAPSTTSIPAPTTPETPIVPPTPTP